MEAKSHNFVDKNAWSVLNVIFDNMKISDTKQVLVCWSIDVWRTIVIAPVLLLLFSSSLSIDKILTFKLLFTHTNWQLQFKFGCLLRTTLPSDNSCIVKTYQNMKFIDKAKYTG